MYGALLFTTCVSNTFRSGKCLLKYVKQTHRMVNIHVGAQGVQVCDIYLLVRGRTTWNCKYLINLRQNNNFSSYITLSWEVYWKRRVWNPRTLRPCKSVTNKVSYFLLFSGKISFDIRHGFTVIPDGFGGLVVSILATGTRVRGFKPGRSRWIFRASGKSSVCLPSEGK